MKIPEQLRHLDAQPGGAEWLEGLSDLVRECAHEWSLRVGEPYDYAFVSLALRVELPDRTPAVLKIGFPHRESEQEAEALAHYDGRGAVTLLARSRARHAMLLERCEPGHSLLDVHDETEAFRTACRISNACGSHRNLVTRSDLSLSTRRDGSRLCPSVGSNWVGLSRRRCSRSS